MNKTIKTVCAALDQLSELVLKATNEQRPLIQVHGWNHPALTRDDLANMPVNISTKLKEANIDEIDSILEKQLATIPSKIQLLHGNTISHMFNGHGTQAIPAYIATLEWIESLTSQLFGWEYITDNKALPANLARRIRSLNTQVNSVTVDKQQLEKQIKIINDATTAAESLPTDLESLKEARVKIEKNLTDAITERGKINELLGLSQSDSEEIKSKKDETDKLVNKCEEAYRITTSKGLAGAFEQRAGKLSTSMWLWVVGLLFSLAIGASIGAERLKLLTDSLASTEPNAGIISLQIVLSILNVGAPLWFAWLATKQIGQRFRLAEDYAYKASVAKAYEGYRKEAARIDEALEARLFNTALTRVEEAPLRLIDHESHGSPWHELVTSNAFQKALKNIPELRDKFIEVAKDGMQTTASVVSSVHTKKVSKTKPEDTSEG